MLHLWSCTKDLESLGILQGELVFRVVGIVDTLVLEFNFNEVDKVLCTLLDDVGMVDGEREHSLRVGWRNLPKLRVGWRIFFSSCAVVSVVGSGGK